MSKSTNLRMYNMLDENNRSYLNFSYLDCEVSYRETGTDEWQVLNISKGGSATENIYVVDGADEWDPDTCAVRLEQEFTLHSLSELFMTDEKKEPLMPVALKDDVIGVTAVWWSDKAKLCGCKSIGEIRYAELGSSNEKTFNLELDFSAGQLAGQLEIFYKLYMKKAGEIHFPGFARDSGVILGDVGSSLILQLDGNGAAFPVYTVSMPGENLWWIEVNIEDPFEDTFTEEYFSLVFNDKHPDYQYLRKRNDEFSPLYYEVFSSALEEFFLVLKRDFGYMFDDVVDINEVTPGTIAYAAIYMKTTFEIDIRDNDLVALHNSVRKAVYKQLKGGI